VLGEIFLSGEAERPGSVKAPRGKLAWQKEEEIASVPANERLGERRSIKKKIRSKVFGVWVRERVSSPGTNMGSLLPSRGWGAIWSRGKMPILLRKPWTSKKFFRGVGGPIAITPDYPPWRREPARRKGKKQSLTWG